MSTYRCTQCGARIEAPEGVKVSTCPACQAVFVLPNQFAMKENLYMLASDARHAGNYDMALNYYSRILKVDGAEPEANWGYLLSKYGIEISENARDYGGIIFHRVEHSEFTKDPAYEKMMTYVPQAARYYYETIARRIDAQHKKLMAISRTLAAPEICIDCTAAQGTEDFLLSIQAGKALEDAGYHIFHPAMLSGVAHEDLNLYEMAAAEKAEAMIVVMTRTTEREDARFAAVWKRFLAYRRADAGRKMLSLFRNLLPEDLPLELQALQSIPCEGNDFQQRVVTEINRMFGRSNRSAGLIRRNLELLRSGEQALADGNWEQAERAYQQAVKNDGEEFRAHWGIVCARTENLTASILDESVDHHYRQALQFADKSTAQRYTEILQKLMAPTAWKAFLDLTDGLRDYRCAENEEVEEAEERIKLYLPPLDSRFQELEDWHAGVRRQKELDALHRAYEQRDTAVEPLFAEQEKAEYAYEHTNLEQMGSKSGKKRVRLLMLSLIVMLISWQLLLQNFTYSTDFDTGFYTLSKIALIGALILVAFWLWQWIYELDWDGKIKLLICLGGAVAIALVCSVFPAARLVLMLVVIVLILVESIGRMVRAGNINEALRAKKKAEKDVCRIEEQLRVSYQAAAEAVCTKYKLPKGEIPDWQVNHSEYYHGFAKLKKQAPAVSYPLRSVVFLAIALLAVTFVNNRIYASDWKHVMKVDGQLYHVLALKEDGTVCAAGKNDSGQCDIGDWENIVDIAVGWDFSAGLTADGHVRIAGGQEELEAATEWTDIVAISAGAHHLVGLKSDGTVVAAGDNSDGNCETGEWTDVVQVLAVSDIDNETGATIGLKSDGSILVAGGDSGSLKWSELMDSIDSHFGPDEGESVVTEMYGITPAILLRTADGEFMGMGQNASGQLEQAEEWDSTQVTQVSLSSTCIALGLTSDGTVLVAGDNSVIREAASDWTDITQISVGLGEFAAGLKSGGTVVAAGKNNVGQLDTEDWEDIVSIHASSLDLYGIRADGKVEASGYSYAGLSYTRSKNPVELLQFWYEVLSW